MFHIPVLVSEVLEYLLPQKGGNYVDGTLGCGGHSEAILAQENSVRILGIDRDSKVIELAKEKLARFGSKVLIKHGNYCEIERLANLAGFIDISGILLDLGFSSYQLDNPARGFSFQSDGPLDMRMDPKKPFSARDLLNQSTEKDLCHIFRKFGEEPKAKKIARAIINENESHPFTSTLELADVIRKVTGCTHSGYSKNVARCFQALRIAVNDELAFLQKGLDSAINILRPGGRLVVISFHSLEDRIVKEKFNHEALECVCPPKLPICCCKKKAKIKKLTTKPIRAGEKEIHQNPRARSAKLRAIEKIA